MKVTYSFLVRHRQSTTVLSDNLQNSYLFHVNVYILLNFFAYDESFLYYTGT